MARWVLKFRYSLHKYHHTDIISGQESLPFSFITPTEPYDVPPYLFYSQTRTLALDGVMKLFISYCPGLTFKEVQI